VGPDPRSGKEFSKEERLAFYEEVWAQGQGYEKFVAVYWDVMVDPELNAEYSDFVRGKIRERIKDPVLREKLTPEPNQRFGARRIPLETGYYETYERDNVSLVDLRETPIVRVTENGIETTERELAFDYIIFATGFDAVTGALTRIDFRGVDGVTLKEKFDREGFATYLGLTSAGFPNFFIDNNSALCNYTICAEWIAEWITEVLSDLRDRGYTRIEPTQQAEDAWIRHHDEMGAKTLWADTKSWYIGTNIPGKPRRFTLYAQIGPEWKKEVYGPIQNGYEGFELREGLPSTVVETVGA
jgi:cyclohexanone monooxygenase